MKAFFHFGLLEGMSVFLTARQNNSGLSDTLDHRRPQRAESSVTSMQTRTKQGLNLGLYMALDPKYETPLSSPKPSSTILINHASNKENFNTQKAVSVLYVSPPPALLPPPLCHFQACYVFKK